MKNYEDELKFGKQNSASNSESSSIFPAHKRINTLEHYMKYCPFLETDEITRRLNRSKIISPVNVDILNIFYKGEVDETLLKLLICGIGVYSKENLSKRYLGLVERLASANQLAYIVSD